MLAQRQISEQRLFRDAALLPERVQLQGVETCAARVEPLLQDACEGEVHVVAAEQDVVADRDALEREVPFRCRHRNQREIGRPAADVAHQHEIADFHPSAPAVPLRVEPCVEGGLRFFERAEIKDVLSYLRLALQPADDGALLRVVNVPARGIGASTLEMLRKTAQPTESSLWSVIESTVDSGRVSSGPERVETLFSRAGTEAPAADLPDPIARAIDGLVEQVATLRQRVEELEAQQKQFENVTPLGRPAGAEHAAGADENGGAVEPLRRLADS